MQEYTVVLRSTGALRVKRDSELKFDLGGRCRATLRPFRTDEGFSVSIPRGVYVQVHGSAVSIDDASREFAAVGVGLLSSLSIATNAYAGDAVLFAAYDCSEGVENRDWMQWMLQLPAGVPAPGRICPSAVEEFAAAVQRHPEGGGRIARACGQYHQALHYWRPGYEPLVLAHLFMAVDALVPALIRKLSADAGLSKKEFAVTCGVDVNRSNWDYELGGRVRSAHVFGGDGDFAKRVRDASVVLLKYR